MEEKETVQPNAEKQPENPFNNKKIRHNIFLVAIILVVVLIILLSQGDISKIAKDITTADFKYIGFGFLVMIGYWFFTSISLHILMKKKASKNLGVIESLCIANSAFFFNGITPFSSGGQPFQVYSYHKCGISPSKSTGVLMMNFIIYQIALNIVSIVAIILYSEQLSNAINGFFILVMIGLTINLLILTGLILIAVSKTFRKLAIFLLKKICNIKFLRSKSESIQYKASRFLVDFQINFKSLFKSVTTLVITLICQVMALCLYFSIPFFIFKAVHVSVTINELLPIMAMSAFAITFMIWIPTPGSSGGAEWAFTVLFPVILVSFTDENVIDSSTLMWRFLTYYSSLIFGFICFLIFNKLHKTKSIIVEEEK